MKKISYIPLFLALALLPALAHAQEFTSLLVSLVAWIGILTNIVGALALLVFFWGLVKYIWAAGDEASKASGKKIMIGGVVALFVFFSVFGLVRFIRYSLDINENSSMHTPRVLPGLP
jgi:hypothetical protein